MGAGTSDVRTITNLYNSKNQMSWSTDSLHGNDGGAGNRSFSYDARGNITRMTMNNGQGRTMWPVYDQNGQMISISGVNPQGDAVNGTYAYNGENKRVRSTVSGRDRNAPERTSAPVLT